MKLNRRQAEPDSPSSDADSAKLPERAPRGGDETRGMSPLELSVAERFAEAVRREFPGRVQELKLFGSRARGEARADSDMDVFVLLDEAEELDRARITDLSTDLMMELGLSFELSPRIFSQPQFNRLRDLERLLPQEIARDGIPL